MKRYIFILAATLLLTSCATNYVVTDHIGRCLDGTRTLLSADTLSLANTPYGQWQRTPLGLPEVFDFRTERDTMRYAYNQSLTRDGWTVLHDSLPRMLRPQVSVSKHFRWFTTRYRYTAVFPALDSLPVPVSDYLTPDEQRVLFQPLDLPSDWNGADMYALLDNLNTKYVKWWSHCCFEKEYEACRAYFTDSNQRALLAQYHDTLLSIVLAQLPEKHMSLSGEVNLFPELAFLTDGDALSEMETGIMAWFYDDCDLDKRALWRVELPGGCTAEYMVSAERLVMGDYTVALDSPVVNWWAVALTLLAVLAPVLWLTFRRRPRNL